jgi:hypothetical protein
MFQICTAELRIGYLNLLIFDANNILFEFDRC